MNDHIYKKIELVGSSTIGIEDAVNNIFKNDPVDQLFQTIDDVLEVDCPGTKM